MNIEAHITELVEGIISEDADLFIVEVRLKGDARNQRVQVFLDGDEGVDIDKCASISRQLGAKLEEEELFEAKYNLEISSPGLDMPLKLIRQYHKNIGRTLKLKHVDGSKYKGELLEVLEEDKLVLDTEKEGKLELFIKEIEEAKVTVSFK